MAVVFVLWKTRLVLVRLTLTTLLTLGKQCDWLDYSSSVSTWNVKKKNFKLQFALLFGTAKPDQRWRYLFIFLLFVFILLYATLQMICKCTGVNMNDFDCEVTLNVRGDVELPLNHKFFEFQALWLTDICFRLINNAAVKPWKWTSLHVGIKIFHSANSQVNISNLTCFDVRISLYLACWEWDERCDSSQPFQFSTAMNIMCFLNKFTH